MDITGLEEYLDFLKDTTDSHITVSVEEPFIYRDLFNQFDSHGIEDLLLFQCRILKHFNLETNTQEFVDDVARGFESIDGLDGDLTFNEKKEGSATFVKLLKDIPLNTKLS